MTSTLSDTQRTILTAAAEAPDGILRPTGNVRGGAFHKVLGALAGHGFAERRTDDPDAYHNAFAITDAGRAAVGMAVPTQEADPGPLDEFDPAAAAEALGWDPDQGETEPPAGDGFPISEDPADEVPDHIAEASADDTAGSVEGDGYGESDIPGTEDPPAPGMVFDQERLVWVEPVEGDDIPGPKEVRNAEGADATPDTAPTGAPEPEGDDTPPAPPEANDAAPVAPTAHASRAADREAVVAAIEALIPFATLDIRHLDGKDDDTIVTGINDTMIRAGDIRRAQAAIAALSSILEYRAAPRRTSEPKAPRTGTKQELVIAMLRRPEGATIAQIAAQTEWLQHTVRGFFAGLKKKGMSITSAKPEGATDRVYRIQA